MESTDQQVDHVGLAVLGLLLLLVVINEEEMLEKIRVVDNVRVKKF